MYIYLKFSGREKQAKEYRDILFAGSFLRVATSRLDQAEAKIQKGHPGLPHGWQKLKL